MRQPGHDGENFLASGQGNKCGQQREIPNTHHAACDVRPAAEIQRTMQPTTFHHHVSRADSCDASRPGLTRGAGVVIED